MVNFNGPSVVDRVRIRNRRDCCGGRLARTKVYVSNQYCGSVQNGTRNGQWYTVKCSRPMMGNQIKLVTVQRTYLSITGIEAYGASTGAMTISRSSTSRTSYNIKANTRVGFNRGSAR
jgi:hypothetical protein